MIEDKKIEDLFRDNQDKLDEMPSPMAWDRLEVRLEKRNVNHRLFAWQRLTVAAAVVIAVSMVGLWMFMNPLGDAMDKTSMLFAEKELASEIIASDAPAPPRPLLMSHREKVEYLTEQSKTTIKTSPQPSIAYNKKPKGTVNIPPQKSIRPQATKPQPQVNIAPITTTDMTVEADIEPIAEEKISEEIAEENIVITKETESEAWVDYKVLNEKAIDSQPVVAGTTTTTTTSTTTNVPTISSPKLPKPTGNITDYAIKTDDIMDEEREEVIVMEEVAKESKKIRKAKRADKEMAKDSNKNEAAPAPTASTEPELDRFDWLLGKWTDEDDNSFEEWQRIAPNILEGKGYFVVDVDTTFTQSMKIVHSNAKVFFMVDGRMVEGKFELENYDDRTATFKNKQGATEQITLKKSANNAYSVTIEKSKKQVAKERRKKKRTFKKVNE